MKYNAKLKCLEYNVCMIAYSFKAKTYIAHVLNRMHIVYYAMNTFYRILVEYFVCLFLFLSTTITPSLIRINMEFQWQWYFFWFLYMYKDECKKREFSKKGGSALPGPPLILPPPLRAKILNFSELFDVGTLNLCLETPGTTQKKSVQSAYPVQRKRPKCC